MHIVTADLHATRLSVTAAQLRRAGAEVVEQVTDVSGCRCCPGAGSSRSECSYGAVHVICNNAGVWTLGYQWDTDLADWQWVLDVNLWGFIHGIRIFVPILFRNTEGDHIVNTVSLGGIVAGR